MIVSEPQSYHFDLERLSDAEAEALRDVVRNRAEGASSRQMAAERLVVELFDSLRDPSNDEPACVLVRCFQTTTYARMPTHYQDAAEASLDGLDTPSNALDQMRCLALLATHGLKSVWNDVLTSVGHQAIPLPSVEVVQKAPMITRLLEQLGMPVERAVAPPDSPEMRVQSLPGEFSVFHIAEAPGSPFIPAQTSFVEPHGICSVLGLGGILPDGELIAVVMFTRVPVSAVVAERFALIAPEVRRVMARLAPAQTFRRSDF